MATKSSFERRHLKLVFSLGTRVITEMQRSEGQGPSRCRFRKAVPVIPASLLEVPRSFWLLVRGPRIQRNRLPRRHQLSLVRQLMLLRRRSQLWHLSVPVRLRSLSMAWLRLLLRLRRCQLVLAEDRRRRREGNRPASPAVLLLLPLVRRPLLVRRRIQLAWQQLVGADAAARLGAALRSRRRPLAHGSVVPGRQQKWTACRVAQLLAQLRGQGRVQTGHAVTSGRRR